MANFSCLQFGPRIRTEGLNSSSRQKEEVNFWCRIVWDYFSLFHSDQINCCTKWIFIIYIYIYILSVSLKIVISSWILLDIVSTFQPKFHIYHVDVVISLLDSNLTSLEFLISILITLSGKLWSQEGYNWKTAFSFSIPPVRQKSRYVVSQVTAGPLWISGNDTSAPEPRRPPESFSDESLIEGTTVAFCWS